MRLFALASETYVRTGINDDELFMQEGNTGSKFAIDLIQELKKSGVKKDSIMRNQYRPMVFPANHRNLTLNIANENPMD